MVARIEAGEATLRDAGPALVTPDHGIEALGVADTHVSGKHLKPDEQPTLATGGSLDRYVILERLGKGSMGEVYAAWDPALDRKVAVKVLRPEHLEARPALVEQLRSRMIREAQALARLSHPNVVAIHDVGVAGPHVFLAMEFVSGKTLKQWLSDEPRTWREIVDVFLAAGEGLAAAHAEGLTHRDFKPDNVVVGDDGRVRVMDFGLAHAHQESAERAAPPEASVGDSAMRRTITQPGALLGTPAYMSPEALYGRPTDFRSDEFSFCAALYEALYRVRPFAGETPGAIALEMESHRLQPAPRTTQVPRRVHQLIVRGLELDPARRFQTMRPLLTQLRRRVSLMRRRAQVAVVAGVAVAVALLAGLAVHRERTRCDGVASRLDDVWDEPTRHAVEQALLGSGKPWAPAAWRDVQQRLDAYASEWVELRRAACETRAGDTDEALGQNLVCLSRALADLKAVSTLLARAEPDLAERAVAAASALPPLDACGLDVATPQRPTPLEDSALEQLAAVKASLDAGRNREALDAATALVDRATSAADRGTLAEAQLLLATAQARLGEPARADATAEAAILLADRAGDDDLLARAWVERVGFAAVAGSADAERWVRFAEAAVDRVSGGRVLHASLANNVGVLAYLRGRFADAVEAHRRALGLRVAQFGETHPLVARTHSNLGAALRAFGRVDEAAGEYRRALAIEEKVLDPTHPAVAETLNNLANVLQQQGDLSGALEAHQRALAIKTQAWGADSLPVAVTLTNLAALLLDRGEVTQAAASLERALHIKERLASPEALTVAVTLTNLAQARRRQGLWADSALLDARALAIRRARQGPGHPDLAYNLTGLGQAELGLGHPAKARASLEEALALRPTPSPARAETAVALARALRAQKLEPTRVRALLLESLAHTPEGSPLRAEAQALLRDGRR